MNVKVFNLVSGVNETKSIVQHKPWECKWVSNKSLCNSKQNGIMMNVSVSVKN